MFFAPLLLLWLRKPFWFPASLRWSLLHFFILGLFVTATSGTIANERRSSDAVKTLRREGTTIDSVSGEIQRNGQRWAFVTSDGTSLRVLENLALYRVTRAIEMDPSDRHWKINGKLTEFAGENFILITRAVRASRVKLESSEKPAI